MILTATLTHMALHPDSPHVMWTREIAFGGIVGEATEDTNYFPGETYDRKFQPPIIMQGRLYYNQRLGTSAYGKDSTALICKQVKKSGSRTPQP